MRNPSNGLFHLRLCYEGTSWDCIEWIQSCNPMTEGCHGDARDFSYMENLGNHGWNAYENGFREDDGMGDSLQGGLEHRL